MKIKVKSCEDCPFTRGEGRWLGYGGPLEIYCNYPDKEKLKDVKDAIVASARSGWWYKKEGVPEWCPLLKEDLEIVKNKDK